MIAISGRHISEGERSSAAAETARSRALPAARALLRRPKTVNGSVMATLWPSRIVLTSADHSTRAISEQIARA